MKKQTFFRSTLCLLLALMCNVAWADIAQQWTANPVSPWGTTDLTSEQYPEGVGTVLESTGGKARLAETKVTAETAGDVTVKFVFSGGSHKLNVLGVDLVDANGTVVASDYHHGTMGGSHNNNTYTLSNVAAGDYTLRYFVCNAGKDGDQVNNTNGNITVTGLDEWVEKKSYTITIQDALTTIKIGDKTYNNGQTCQVAGTVKKSDITVVAPDGKFAAVSIDDVAGTINVYFATLPTQAASDTYMLPVLYPAQQTEVGEAVATTSGNVYTLSNNVLAASFAKMGGALYFAGSKAMDLVAGTEPFTVAFGAGDNVPASAMTLESVAFEELTGKANAVGGAEHYDGHALVANYKYTYNGSTIAIVWRAVLRDGSHYLRTEMELKGENDVDMFNIIPMIYNVDTKAAGSTPEVIGNTRGAVLMSNKIFAGLETPTAYNTVGDATGEEDKWNLTTTIDPVTVEANAWVQMTEAEANQAKRVEEATGATYPNLYAFKKEGVELEAGQKVEVTLTYKQGSNKLYIGGIDLLASNGDIAAMDYHVGYTGSSHDKNTYTFIAPNSGTYAIRAIVHNKSEAINAKSELTTKIYTPKEGVVINTDIVGIQGRWSRNTTLAKDETWKVAAVVGLIAQDGTQANADIHSTQKRRSFLAYSERERAVPWRAMSMYLAWYELQINRNNAAPGREHIDNTEESEVLDVMDHWKSDFYSRYGIAPEIFIVDDGWDKYGEWTFHPGFPEELRNMSAAAKEMGSSIGAWLGPVGGYGQSGNYRRDYWSDKGGMQLSNPRYYKAFKDAAYNLVKNQGDNYVFFKFDGISAQFSATGPDAGDTGNENAEGIIRLEQYVREELREDIFFNTSVGTWASPFWYQITDATWRQENDHDRTGNNSINRENWITYRDRLVYQNYVQNSPICPINTLMTHGFILTKFGPPAGDSREYIPVRNELRAAFLCGSGMVELYNDYDLMNSINGGALWADLAECIAWQKRNADVLPDAHWVGGNPWTGSKAEVYGWAAWNGTKSSLALRNGANDAQTFTFTLRKALNIPANVSGSIILRSAFGDQAALEGLTEGKAYGIDENITVTLPGSSVYGFEGIKAGSQKSVSSIALTAENAATEVEMGKTLVLKAAVNADATFPALTWASSDEEVATVVGGLVLPKKVGTVTITATAKDGSGKTASYKLTIAPKPVTLQVFGAENITVTIKGTTYQEGDNLVTLGELQTSDITVPAVDGKFSVVNMDDEGVYVSYVDSNTQFYTLKGGHGGYVSLAPDYCDGDGNLKLTNSSTIKDRRGLWTFVAQADGGYKIYNYTTGLSKVLGMTGSEGNARATMVAPDATTHTTTFDGIFNFDGTASFIKLNGSANNYWNKRGDYLALWNSTSANDQGSSFYINAVDYNDYVDEIIPITPEAKEELDASLIKGATSFTPENANTLWYTTSAQASGVSYPWMEYALPLGNGELGCMVFGGVLKEELQFNEKTLWNGPANVVGVDGGKRTYFNFGSLFIKNLDETIAEGVTDYVRYLDIEEGVAGVQFTNKNGTKQTRKYFSSAPDQVIAAQYKSEGTDKMHLLFKLEAESELDAKYVNNNSNVKYENGMASFSGALTAVNYAARVHVYANNDAVITTTENGIEVSNATEVTFYLKGATNFNGDVTEVNNYFTTETPADVNANVKAAIDAAHTKGYTAVETAHVANFKEITGRMTLDLGLTTPTVDTKTLIDNYYPNNGDGNSTANDHLFLEQLYFHYGRYLAISSNRKDIAAPNNLQGIWNDRASDSPWNSDVHTNINIQMNYWPTEITNLSDLHKPFVNFIIRGAQSAGWKEVATRYNEGHGWSTLTETSLYNSMSTWGSNYLVANVWYTSHLWTHYRYTQDKEFLKKAFPVMWSAAEFWFHRLIPDKGYDSATQNSGYRGTAYKFEPDGTYVAPNEYSAEQDAHNSEDGTAHAQQMISYLFENISEAITILGRENVNLTDEQIATLNDYLAKTDKGLHTEVYTANSALNSGWTNPRNGVKQGDVILREWKYSPYDVSSDPGHRHLSHLMALFPMDQITPESPYFEPAVNSLKLRGDAATGWSMGWKVNLWARAQDGDHAHLIIKNALKHSTSYGTNAGAGGIYYNLFDSHAPFQIDGNFGVCSGMAEMLMQSAHGYINILPALPAVWEKTGAVTGMKAIGNFTVSFNWKDGKAQQVTIVSNAGAELKVRCNRGAMNIADALITVNGTEVIAKVDENGIATIPNVEEGQTVVVDFTKRRSVAVKVYAPGNRATTLVAGKKYMIYNTCFNGSEDRTGFLYDNGSGLGHTGSPKKKPDVFKTINNAYLWEVVATDEEGKFYLKAADGGYVNASGKTDNAEAQVIYIQPWNTSTATKAGVKSEGADGTVIENVNIGGDVFTISGTKVGNTNKDCWNGNPNTFATWESAHPYAFYEVEDEEVLLGNAFPLPGHTYYIYCDNDTRQYFYNDGGTLKVSEKRVEWSNEYLFTCSFDGTCFQFKNAKGKYLGHKALSDNAHNFKLTEYLGGVNLQSTDGNYFVMKADGGFDQSTLGTYDPASTDCSTVYKFEEFLFPVDGETYYIYSDTYYNDEYVNRYMYADGSNLKLNTSLSVTDAYKWTCKVTDEGYVQFQNGAGKYLKHKGVQDTPYNFTLNKYNANHAIAATLYSVADSRYFVVKNNGAEFNQSTGTYNQTSGDWCSDFVFMPVNDVKVLTVNGSNKADGATATWNGETKTLPATWVITPQTTITDATLSVNGGANYKFNGLFENGTELGESAEVSDFETNHTITAKLTPSFFSASTNTEDLVAVRIRNVRNNKYTLRLNASDNYTGHTVNTGETAYGENEIWYLVGTDESFKIYSRVAGMGLHVVLAGTGGGSAASMNTTDTNADFCLVAKDNGYAICPKANTGQSFNMHGGAGADIKLYGAGDGGSVWIIEKMDASKSLTFSVNIEGETWEGNRGAGAITITVDGIAGKANIESFVGEQKCYLPLNGTFTIASDTYRGYTFNGFNVNGSTIETLVDQTLSEDLNVVASYTANEEKVLYYTPSPTGNPYRIPAIATAPNGHIFAIADHRPCGNDIGYGEVDIKCRISTDNGATWSDEFFIADGQGGDSNNMTTGYGDAAVVADRESNKLLVMMVAGRTVCHNGRWDTSKIGVADADAVNRVARIYLTYNETTGEWEKSEIVEMTDHIYSLFLNGETPTVTSMFIGSGKICQSRVVKKGDYYRLYCSMWTRDGGNRVIYSDDFGGSWNVLGTINDRPASGGDEPKVEELRDGTVVLSSRVGGGRIFNLFTFADNTYTTGSWGTAVRSNEITNGLSFGGNSTNGEIYKVKAIHKESGRICDLMLQSIPTGGGRSDVAIYYKELDAAEYNTTTIAQNWTKGKHVSYKGSAYSTMISQADGRIAFLFEEEPGGYCIVYIPYTIEDVTGGAYSLYQVNSTIGEYEIGTFYASEAVVIPEGVQAYVATEEPVMEGKTGVITMTELEGIIPANTGAVLRGAAKTYEFIPSISYGTAVESNMLVGYEANNTNADLYTEASLAEESYTSYVLTVMNKEEGAGFYRRVATEEKPTLKVYNNKAYLQVPATIAANSLAIRFDGDGTTDIESSTLNPQPSTEVYDLQGRRVLNPTKGVYIVGGKKVVIK